MHTASFWKFDGPVLPLGPQDAWDGLAISEPTVVWDGELYRMYYEGLGRGDDSWRVGLATSRDLVNWQRHASNPVLDPHGRPAWCNKDVLEPSVLRDGDGYHMWFTANLDVTPERSEIGYARSADGICWDVLPEPAVSFADLERSGTGFTGVSEPVVVERPGLGGWIMYFQTWREGRSHIGCALSRDRLRWQLPEEYNPVLAAGAGGGWDASGVAGPEVVVHRGLYYMFYNSWRDPQGACIGLAVSPDGQRFARCPDNPILRPTPAGGKSLFHAPWDQHSVYEPGVWVAPDGAVLMLFGGLRCWTGSYDRHTALQIGAAVGRLPEVPAMFAPATR